MSLKQGHAVIISPGRNANAANAAALSNPPAVENPVHARHHFSFHTFLSELNPLQYIPIIGTLYRAVTGDTIPVPVRDAGSMLFSGLIAGPIGVATDIGELAAEKISGFDPEKIGDRVLAKMGIRGPLQPVTELAESAGKSAQAVSASPWSASQLAAYGVTVTPGGDLKLASLQGSDVLNRRTPAMPPPRRPAEALSTSRTAPISDA